MNSAWQTILPMTVTASLALAAAFWQGILLALAVALCLRLMPGLTAATKSMLWTVVLLMLVALHFGPLVAQQHVSAALAEPRLLSLDDRWSVAIAFLWLAASAIRATRLVGSAIALQRIARQAKPVAMSSANAKLLRRSGRSIQVCASLDVDRPCVAGFLTPRILLPADLLGTLSEPELKQVLLHELEHLRRRDDWTNLLQKLALVLFPLNPGIAWVERQMCTERELACDDRVLRTTGARKAYATCLANLADHRLMRRGFTLALGAWECRSELARRVGRILEANAEMSPRISALVTSVLAVALTGAGLLLTRSPQLVSFAPRHRDAEVWARSLQDAATITNREGTAHAVNVKAIMPAQPVRLVPGQSDSTLGRAAQQLPTSRKAAQRQRRSRPRMMLTNWSREATRSRASATVVQEDFVSYAAVATQDGWLLIQL